MRVHPQQLAQVLYTSVSREPKHATAFFKKFMLFIEQHGLQSFLPEIKRHLALLKEADDRKNRMVITTPYALSAVGVNKILKAFGSVQGVFVEKKVNPDLIAGLIVQHDGMVYDMSTQGQLKRLERLLAQ